MDHNGTGYGRQQHDNKLHVQGRGIYLDRYFHRPGMDGKEMVLTIKEGKINGNNVSFSITFDFGGNEMKMEYKGVVSADQIKLTSEMMGQPMEQVLKRAK